MCRLWPLDKVAPDSVRLQIFGREDEAAAFGKPGATVVLQRPGAPVSCWLPVARRRSLVLRRWLRLRGFLCVLASTADPRALN